MEDPSSELYPMTTKRQKILDKAIAQLRKSREAMDPGVLKKIRRMVASSPEIMKKLGLTEELKPQEADMDMPLSAKTPLKSEAVKEATPKDTTPKAKRETTEAEKIVKELLEKVAAERAAAEVAKAKAPTEEKAALTPKSYESSKGYEKVDQAKTMEVMAKLMMLNPAAKENIKSVIKKTVK